MVNHAAISMQQDDDDVNAEITSKFVRLYMWECVFLVARGTKAIVAAVK